MMDRETAHWLLPLLLAAGVGAAIWYYWSYVSQQAAAPVTVEQAPEQPAIAADERSEPLHPIEDAGFNDDANAELRPLPGLEDSDDYFKLELTDIFGEQFGALIAESGIIGRVVATVDNLPRSHVAERIRPVSGLGDAFVADPEGGDLFAVSEESYRRYDSLVGIIEGADITELVSLYRRYYPLFQSAYIELGYPNAYFNDRLVEAIDDMLVPPELSGKIILVRPHVLYKFQNPNLEARSSGQKLLLRMGSENAQKIKAKLQELRDAIT